MPKIEQKPQKMTEKQKKFCDFYLKHGNATQASIEAGYSDNVAGQQGAENLKKSYINNYIKEKSEKQQIERDHLGKITINSNIMNLGVEYFNGDGKLLVEFIESKILSLSIKKNADVTDFKKRRALKKDGKYFILQRAGFKCQACGNKPTKENNIVLAIDHIIPHSLGGSLDYDNLQALCNECNLSKSNNFSIDHNE